jgi:hypothetical protein
MDTLKKNNDGMLSIITHRIQRCLTTETAMNWFLYYQNQVENQNKEKPMDIVMFEKKKHQTKKKRKLDDKEQTEGIEVEDEEEKVQLTLSPTIRCQLANTLYDFERNGLILIKKGEGKHVMISKSIFTGIN